MNPASCFTVSWIVLAVAWLLLWLPRHTGYRCAWIGAVTGFCLITGGFALRVALVWRAPVTNMYESIIFAAWGVVLLSMVFEYRRRSGAIFLSALPVAIVGLALASERAGVFDSGIHPLPAALRNNFWLLTHVTTITLGYAAFAVAMGMGHWILWKGFVAPTRGLEPALERSLQIGVMLLGTGIVLGGFWAWQVWGRFWGWDPKETWALITLLGYVALLHGRRAGWWGGFGLAIGSVVSFQCVIMAWYGVNFLLKPGLHSYGSGQGWLAGALGFALGESIFLVVVWIRRLAREQLKQ